MDAPQSTPPASPPISETAAPGIAQIRQKLANHSPRRLSESHALSHAAVAVILRENTKRNEPEILVIQRAEHPLDPWSGHLGFPGGRLESNDASPERAAVRETLEEISLCLDTHAQFLGALSEVRAYSLSRQLPLSIFPFVYALVKPAPLSHNGEVVKTCWVPLHYFLNIANRSTMSHPREPERIMPCYPLGDRALWGISLRIMDELVLDVLGK